MLGIFECLQTRRVARTEGKRDRGRSTSCSNYLYNGGDGIRETVYSIATGKEEAPSPQKFGFLEVFEHTRFQTGLSQLLEASITAFGSGGGSVTPAIATSDDAVVEGGVDAPEKLRKARGRLALNAQNAQRRRTQSAAKLGRHFSACHKLFLLLWPRKKGRAFASQMQKSLFVGIERSKVFSTYNILCDA